MKPDNLTKVTINTTKINDYAIKKLEIDLIHINYGLNKKKELNTKPRSHFTVQDVVSIFESLDGVVFECLRTIVVLAPDGAPTAT